MQTSGTLKEFKGISKDGDIFLVDGYSRNSICCFTDDVLMMYDRNVTGVASFPIDADDSLAQYIGNAHKEGSGSQMPCAACWPPS